MKRDKQILVITQYFYPDLAPPAIRLYEMLKFVAEEKNLKIKVITTTPHYRVTKQTSASKSFDMFQNIEIYRLKQIKIGINKPNLPEELLRDVLFALKALFFSLRFRHLDIIFCTIPPIMTGTAGFLISKIKKAKLIVDVRDLWIDAKVETNDIKNKVLLKLLHFIENKTLASASAISIASPGFLKKIDYRISSKRKIVEVIPNGCDFKYYNCRKREHLRKKYNFSEKAFIVVYVGRINCSQGLEALTEGIRILGEEQVVFLFVGDGPKKEEVIKKIKAKKITNAFFYPLLKENF